MHKFEYAFYQESSLNAVQTWVNGKAKDGFELHSFIGVGEGFAAVGKKDLQPHVSSEEAGLKKVDLPDRNYSVPTK